MNGGLINPARQSRIHPTMKAILTSLFAIALSLVPLHAQDDGFVSLFDGKTLDGWKNPYKWGEAVIVDGEIHLKGDKKWFLVTEKSYSDFIFEGEVRLPEGQANSGFMFRAHVEPNKVFGYQAEVDGDANRKWSGGLYDEGRRQWFISPVKEDAASVAAFRKRGRCFQAQRLGTGTASPAKATRSPSRSTGSRHHRHRGRQGRLRPDRHPAPRREGPDLHVPQAADQGAEVGFQGTREHGKPRFTAQRTDSGVSGMTGRFGTSGATSSALNGRWRRCQE